MRIKDLIRKLQDIDPEAEVLLSKDEEGNAFHPLAEIGKYYYTGSGYQTEVFGEKDKPAGAASCIVLWP